MIANGEKLVYQNKLKEAISYYHENLKSTKDLNQRVLIYFGLAEAHKLNLQYDEASTYYTKAFEILKKTKNEQLTFLYHVKMAEFYRKRTLFKESIEQLDLAAVLLKNNPIEDQYLTKYFSRKAALFTEYFQKQDSTFYYANKSLEIAK